MTNNLNKLPKGYEPPSIEELKKVISETVEESQSFRRLAKKQSQSKVTSFICFAIEELEWLLQFYAVTKLSFLNELAISRRKHLEIYIDLIWVYKIYRDDNEIAEELCSRFYQVGAQEFNDLQSGFKYQKNDLFLDNKQLFDEHLESLEKARKVDYINLDPTNGSHKKSNLFKTEWRAHPKLFDQSKKMRKAIYQIRDRIKSLKPFFQDHFNISNPPFLRDYDRLNQIAHWTPFGYRKLSFNSKNIMYKRELNIMLGYHHDVLNLLFEYLDKDIPESVSMIRMKFPWLS